MVINNNTLSVLNRDLNALSFFSDFKPDDKITINKHREFEKKVTNTARDALPATSNKTLNRMKHDIEKVDKAIDDVHQVVAIKTFTSLMKEARIINNEVFRSDTIPDLKDPLIKTIDYRFKAINHASETAKTKLEDYLMVLQSQEVPNKSLIKVVTGALKEIQLLRAELKPPAQKADRELLADFASAYMFPFITNNLLFLASKEQIKNATKGHPPEIAEENLQKLEQKILDNRVPFYTAAVDFMRNNDITSIGPKERKRVILKLYLDEAIKGAYIHFGHPASNKTYTHFGETLQVTPKDFRDTKKVMRREFPFSEITDAMVVHRIHTRLIAEQVFVAVMTAISHDFPHTKVTDHQIYRMIYTQIEELQQKDEGILQQEEAKNPKADEAYQKAALTRLKKIIVDYNDFIENPINANKKPPSLFFNY